MKARVIHTKIWQDSFVADLNPTEKLVFIYLITNERINIIHCYECPDRVIAFDTGVGRDVIASTKSKLQAAGKIRCFKDWVQLVNADRYQQFTGTKNDLAKSKEISQMPADVFSWYNRKSDTPIDTPIDTLMDTQPIGSVSIISNQYSVISKEEGVGETKPESSPNYLLNLPPNDTEAFCEQFNLQPHSIKNKAESLHDWYLGNPRKNKRENWKATLRSALRKDADDLRAVEQRNAPVLDLDALRAERERNENLSPTTNRK